MKKINEIFYSLQGEGFYTGTAAIFIRFSGCNLKCDFCDTLHESGEFLSDEEILQKISLFESKHIVLTGGEPSLWIDEAGLVGFLYLELIDASFSLDGVLGAFALSKDILIITIGLFIGAMFVRSLTIMLVEKKTLKQFLYLEHGAHWAIGVLAILMFISTFHHVPEVITGLLGLAFIVSALISSLMHNRNKNGAN